jgi:hypothetical protein
MLHLFEASVMYDLLRCAITALHKGHAKQISPKYFYKIIK